MLEAETRSRDARFLPDRLLPVVTAAMAALGGVLFGYDTGVISGALLFVRADFSLTTGMVGVLTAAVLAGAATGALISGYVADRFGRRWALLITALVFVTGSLACSIAPDILTLIVARFLVGIGIGIASFVAPLYIAEIAPARHRGALVSLNQLAITLGILASFVVSYHYAATGDWRVMFGLGAFPGALLAIGMTTLPETPRWLMARGREEEARLILERLEPGSDAENAIARIRQVLLQERKTGEVGARALLHPAMRKPLVTGVGLAVLQQVTGINTIIYYAPTVFQMVDYGSASASILATAGIGIVNVLATLFALLVIDRWGRRRLLLSGLIGMTICLCILGVGFRLNESGELLGRIVGLSLAGYIGFFAIGLGPVFWLMISEIFSLGVRARAMSIATFANWIANLIVALTFLHLAEVAGAGIVFFAYAILSAAALVFAWYLVPETKGRILEDIGDEMRQPIRPHSSD